MKPTIQLTSTLALLAFITAPSMSQAWSPSPDVGFASSGMLRTAGDVIRDGGAPASPPFDVDLGPLPDGADVVAFTLNDEATPFFVLAHTMELPGGILATPRTVIRYDDGVYSEELDLGDFGVPDGVAIDAIGVIFATSGVGFSFDTTVDYGGFVLDDADVLDAFNSSLAFDASAAGVPRGLDLDAFSETTNGDWLVSFDTGGTISGVTFADEDILRVTPAYTWSMEIDASSHDVAWERADVDALHTVPEPGFGLQFGSGALALSLLGARRRRCAD